MKQPVLILFMTNLQIAELLRDVAASYQLKDQNKYKFQIIAYQRAADSVEHATSELKDLWDDGKLDSVPGIGPSIAQHLDEIFRTGKSRHFTEIMSGIPEKAFKLMELPGIGIKTAMKLLVESPKNEVDKLLKEVEIKRSQNKRHLLPYATLIAKEVIDWMKKDKNVIRIDPLGSLRRQAATIGDIDISVATNKPLESLEHFTNYPKVQKVIEKGTHSSSIVVPGGLQVDLMVQPLESYGSLLQHFTGSKNHNVTLREYALKKGLSLNEYGIKKVGEDDLQRKHFDTEEKFYEALGLDWISPEIREDQGEVVAAKNHTLPNLVELKDIKGDLQIHSNFNIETSHDLGQSSMEEIIKKAEELKYEYLAFTEHNPSQKGHTEKDIVEILKRKREKIDELNYSRTIKLFNSLEIDILPNGNLPVPDIGMEMLDFALVSVHSSFDQPRDQMTKRVLSALSHPRVKIFAHPTARKLNEREGIELNWQEIFEFCLKNNKWLEIDADPARLDLPDTLVHEAVKLGVKMTMGTDAHHKDGMNNMACGISVARRGWAEKKDIVNTLSLADFEKVIQ